MGRKMNMILLVVAMVATIACLIGTPVSATTSGAPPTCLASISTGCNITADSSDTVAQTAQLDQCCKVLTNSINKQRTCFCLLKPYLEDDSGTDSIASLFTYCKIDGTFDTLCPTDDGTTTPSGDTSSGSSTDDVPSTSTTPTSTSSSTTTGGSGNNEGLFGGKKNAGSKMASTSLSGLLIVVISVMMI